MPAPTVVSSRFDIMGPPDKDGSFFQRNTIALSDGRSLYYDQPHLPAGSNSAQILADIITSVSEEISRVPSPVTSVQARSAVYNAGLRAAVEQAVANADAATQELWYTASEIDRNHPSLVALGIQIGLTSDQLDDLFRTAATL